LVIKHIFLSYFTKVELLLNSTEQKASFFLLRITSTPLQ